MSSSSLRSSPLAHLSALLTNSVGGGGGSSCTGSTTGGSSPSAFAFLTNCVDGALGLVDDDDNVNATKNKDEDDLIATKAAAKVANDDCNSNNDQHKGTYASLCMHHLVLVTTCVLHESSAPTCLSACLPVCRLLRHELAEIAQSHPFSRVAKWYPSLSFLSFTMHHDVHS